MTRTMLRRAAVAGTALVTLFAVPACAGADHTSTGHGSTSVAPTGSAAPGAVFNDADVAFAQHMIVHHRQAVEMAELADSRAANPQVKELAGKIKAAQGPEITTMTGWLGAWGRPAPDAGAHETGHESMPGMMSEAQMTMLTSVTGATFDRQFLTMMIAHHEGAVTMADDENAQGASAEAKALAAKIVVDQQAEITTMKDLLGKV